MASVYERSRHLHWHTMEGITATLVSFFSNAYLQRCSGLLSLRFYCYGIIVLYISEIPLLFSLLIQHWLDYQATVVKDKIHHLSKVRSWADSECEQLFEMFRTLCVLLHRDQQVSMHMFMCVDTYTHMHRFA